MNRLPSNLPTVDELVEGQIYRIHSRNLVVGAWVPAPINGFVGIRQKFGDEYLFTEYHRDTGGRHGTVGLAEPLLVDGQPLVVPSDCPLYEYEPESICRTHRRPVEFRDDNPPKEGDPPRAPHGKWYHLDDDTQLDDNDYPTRVPNHALFALLKPLSDAEYDRRAEIGR